MPNALSRRRKASRRKASRRKASRRKASRRKTHRVKSSRGGDEMSDTEVIFDAKISDQIDNMNNGTESWV